MEKQLFKFLFNNRIFRFGFFIGSENKELRKQIMTIVLGRKPKYTEYGYEAVKLAILTAAGVVEFKDEWDLELNTFDVVVKEGQK